MEYKKREIDPRSFDVEENRGAIILFAGPMGVGKSEIQVLFLNRFATFSRYKVLAFGHQFDGKAGEGQIASRTGLSFPAVKEKDARSLYDRVAEESKSGFVDIVGIDELLYWGNDLIPFLQQMSEEERVIVLSALSGDFRNEKIPLVERVSSLQMTSRHDLSAVCQVERGGKPCSRPADISFKMYPSEKGIRVCDKGRVVDRLWAPADYWTPTIQPQPSHDPYQIKVDEPFYVAACDKCFKLPGKEETFYVLNTIKKAAERGLAKDDIIDYHADNYAKEHLDDILKFLSDPSEGRKVRFDKEKGLYFYTGPIFT